ncbi:MAG: squalene/phytoene synthase family protein, partial [Hyphomonas sp.]
MTLTACTEALREHDPLRFGAVLVAEPGDRAALVTLYALNLEIARAPFQSAEPLLAEMRLQWWVERLAEMGRGTAPPLHDVLTPLWDAWGTGAGALAPLAEARRRDCAREPFDTPDDVLAYVEA